ncbi:hypothetical protein BK127_28260 [Paenibacillus sp. FSL H7-0331]|nr:hypothetical protein BK127_28260 [Paenibacillus sp. FSL H7-0331]
MVRGFESLSLRKIASNKTAVYNGGFLLRSESQEGFEPEKRGRRSGVIGRVVLRTQSRASLVCSEIILGTEKTLVNGRMFKL